MADDDTAISWTHRPGTCGRTWNPTEGCSRVSEGCRNCYAERIASRFAKSGWSRGLINLKTRKWSGELRVAAHKLRQPLSWRDPSTIFVNSMSDLFHESLTNEQIAAVFAIAAACPQHVFQCLTKRSRRMRDWHKWLEVEIEAPACEQAGADCAVSIHAARDDQRIRILAEAAAGILSDGSEEDWSRWYMRISDAIHEGWARRGPDGGTEWSMPWPLPNWWQGISVENQEAAEERIPDLLATPATIRFLSCEPLLGELELDRPRCYRPDHAETWCVADDGTTPWCPECDSERSYGHWLHADGGVDWVIAGCESGPGARPADVTWFRSLRNQCAIAGTRFFLKQAVEQVAPLRSDGSHEDAPPYIVGPGKGSWRKHAGVIELPYLDGVQHAEFPEAAR